ncbi:MAG: tRNA (adenosine(37)-N6)-threonylcarbamoyltransferase complex dimerization subunit type 1 TsaB [Clostridia bacterium]|nr:tRNA (adenosine(37)-N6)-threonylcarbamoyltransferase complex dimerization subunit type 1 TsaB [Clostridia bacterium]
MRILAVDSSALAAGAAVCEDERLVAEYTLNNGNTHSENLLPMVESILKLAKLSIGDIDLLACTAGPGSFTGVRIGVSTIKGLAFGTGIPCVGVSTIEALAGNLAGCGGLIVPVMNARRQQVYTALFRDADGKAERLTEDAALAAEDLFDLIRKTARPQEPVRFCGDGYQLIADCLPKGLQACTVPVQERLRWQSAYWVARCALNAFRAGKATTDEKLVPTYLRPSQAERNLKRSGQTEEQ